MATRTGSVQRVSGCLRWDLEILHEAIEENGDRSGDYTDIHFREK